MEPINEFLLKIRKEFLDMTLQDYKAIFATLADETNIKEIRFFIAKTDQGEVELVYNQEDNDLFLTVGGEFREMREESLLKLAQTALGNGKI